MQPISAEIVTKTYEEQARMTPMQAAKLVDSMSKEQPLLLAYLMAVEQEELNQEERELLLYLGITVWRIMSQGEKELIEVSEATLEEMEEKNMKMLEYLEKEPEKDFGSTVEAMFTDYNQKEVLRYVLEALLEGEDEESNVRDEMKGIMAIDLKTVIDCLDQ